MYFAIYCLDRPDALDIRLRTRDTHRAYLHRPDLPVKLKLAGPLLGADGKTMLGSLIVVDADNLSTVEAFCANDPYRKAGLVGSVSIRPWNWTAGNPDLE
jgi:uncharacterized protein